MSILTVDFHSKNAPELLCQSLKETGFAVLCNHPIAPSEINLTYQKWQQFFLLDEAQKLKFLYQKPSQAGYFPFKTEKAKNRTISDLKEFYHVYPWGPIPDDLKEISLKIYTSLYQLAETLLQWIENCLPKNLSKQLFTPLKDMINDSHNTLLRILHYPPLDDSRDPNAVRAAPHEDINLITLLPAATTPGLEVLDTKDQWHKVNCDPGSIVINVGDMLQMCTGFYYRSTTHRVINPKESANESRYSMPLFLHPNKNVKLSPTCTAEEYLTKRLQQIGIY